MVIETIRSFLRRHLIRPSRPQGPTLVSRIGTPPPDIRSLRVELAETQRLLLRASIKLRRLQKELNGG